MNYHTVRDGLLAGLPRSRSQRIFLRCNERTKRMTPLKKTFLTVLSVLTLIAAPAAATPAALDAEAQIDVMAASGVIQNEINDLYHTWDSILKSNRQDRSHYEFYAAVTDLDANGRLELLISKHFLNKDPLYYAGESISDAKKKGLTALSQNYLSRVYGEAYEISADGTSLEPLIIQHTDAVFPDFTHIYTRAHKTDGNRIYHVDTQLMPRDDSIQWPTERYNIVYEAQMLWLDAGHLSAQTNARIEGTAGALREIVDTYYTSMKLLGPNKNVDPYGVEAADFWRGRADEHCIRCASWEELSENTRAALAASWQSFYSAQD